MNQPESMNPVLIWPAALGLGWQLHALSYFPRQLSRTERHQEASPKKCLAKQQSNSKHRSFLGSHHAFLFFCESIVLSKTQVPQCFGWLWGAMWCYQASCAGSISHKIMSSRISLRYSMNIRMSRRFLGSCHWQKLADDQTIRWQPETKTKHMKHPPILCSSVKGQGSRFFEVSAKITWRYLESISAPARRPWWHRDWGCAGIWTARLSACSLHGA